MEPNTLIKLKLHNNPLVLNDGPDLEMSASGADTLLQKISARISGGVGGNNPTALQPIIIDIVAGDIREFVEKMGGIEATIAAAQAAYKKFVVPIDLPGIPNFVEPTVDAAFLYAIGIVLKAAWMKLEEGNNSPKLASIPNLSYEGVA